MRTRNLQKEGIRIGQLHLLDIGQTTGEHSFKVFPDHLNDEGILTGVKLLAEIDIAAIKPIRRLLYNTECDTAVTARITDVEFIKPAFLGDIIEIRAKIFKLGKSTINVFAQVARKDSKGNVSTICVAKLVFVSLKNGEPYKHNVQLNYN